MKKVNTVLVTLILTKVSIKIRQGSDSVTEKSQVLQKSVLRSFISHFLGFPFTTTGCCQSNNVASKEVARTLETYKLINKWVALGKCLGEFVYLAVEICHRGTLLNAT